MIREIRDRVKWGKPRNRHGLWTSTKSVMGQGRKLLRNYWALILTILVAIGFAGFYLVGPFLNNYDAAGHQLAVQSMQEFWPLPIGWDNTTFLGYMQGQAYPNLTHWLATGLSFFMSTGAALKIIVGLAIIALPITIWLWLKNRSNNQYNLLIIFAILLLVPAYVGSNFAGLFTYGLITNFATLPLLFLFMMFLEKSSKSRRYMWFAGLIFGLITWSHIVVTITTGIVFIATLLTSKRPKKVLEYWPVVAVPIIMAAPLFWGIIQNSATIIPFDGGNFDPLFGWELLIPVTVVIIFLLFKKRWNVSLELRTAVLILTLVFATPILMWMTDFPLLHHVYRLQLFVYIFAAVALVEYLIAQKIRVKWLVRLKHLAPIICCLLLISLSIYRFYGVQKIAATVELSVPISGRFIESFSQRQTSFAPYAIQQRIIENDNSAEWAKGLFTEQAPNAVFISSLIKSLQPDAYNNLGDGINEVIKSPTDTAKLLRLFGISHVISLDNNPIDAIGTLKTGGKTLYYHDQVLNENTLVAEIIDPEQLQPVTHDWNTNVKNWWRHDTNHYLYDASNGKIAATAIPDNAKLEILKYSRTKIDLRVDSPKPVPVLIKVTYDSAWRATDANNKSIPIHRFSPFLMMVEAKGRITMSI